MSNCIYKWIKLLSSIWIPFTPYGFLKPIFVSWYAPLNQCESALFESHVESILSETDVLIYAGRGHSNKQIHSMWNMLIHRIWWRFFDILQDFEGKIQDCYEKKFYLLLVQYFFAQNYWPAKHKNLIDICDRSILRKVYQWQRGRNNGWVRRIQLFIHISIGWFQLRDWK